MPDPAVVRAEAEALCSFLDAAPSAFHACAELAERLRGAGWLELDESATWDGASTSGGRFVVRDGSLVAWWQPELPARALRLIGAHTDSPNLRIKPRPDKGHGGFRQLGVEVYGGVLLNSWLDRDLGLAARVAVRDPDAPGGVRTQLLRVQRALAHIPQLAVHLDRDVNERGLVLNRQLHLDPIWATGGVDARGFATFLEHELGVNPGDVLSWDAMLHDVTPAAFVGMDGSMLASGRIDNLLSCHAAISALLRATKDGPPHDDVVPVVALFDHEEVGSVSARGADSSLLETVLARMAATWPSDALARALASSLLLSSDGAHATNPNYADRHDREHQVACNVGPVLKHNVNERYATDASGAGEVTLLAEAAGVALQHFTSRADLPCGSTIGPLTAARLGVRSVDVGAAQLSMHAAREMTGASDPGLLTELLVAHLLAT